MRFDRYQPCPCGSGKKVKFCCSADIVDDLARVVRMMEGDQRAAALDTVEKLLAKHPNRPSLLAFKCDLEIQLDRLANARETAKQFSDAAPNSAVACAHSAMLHAANRQTREAVEMLQHALELSEDEIPVQVYEAIGEVGYLLLATGNIIAARGHFLMQAAIADEDDPQPSVMLVRLSASADVPLLLKEEQILARRPEDVPWGRDFDEALESYERGTWLVARDQFRQLAEQAPTEPAVLKNAALLSSLLADHRAAIDTYRRYAQLEGLPQDDAVEAEALAQLLDTARERRKFDVLRVIYDVPDAEKLQERLLSDRRAARMPLDRSRMGGKDGPPPKAGFWILDRPLAETGEGLKREDVPYVIGEVLLFGKETDREARLELLITRDETFENKLNAFLELAGEPLGEAKHEQVVSQVSAVNAVLLPHWHLPEDTPRRHRLALMAEELRDAILNRWPEQRLTVLDDKTPAEVSADPNYRIPLLAAIFLLESTAEMQNWEGVDLNQLRSKLGLPTCEPIDPTTLDVARVPLVRLARLDVEKLSDDDLVHVYNRAAVKRARTAVAKTGTEIIRRESLDEKTDKAGVYQLMAQMASSTDQALELLGKAKQVCRAKGNSIAMLLISELDIRLRQGDGPEAQRLVNVIQTSHAKEPGVHESLIRLLASYGLVRPDGLPAAGKRRPGAGPAEPAGAPTADAGIWTPDSGSPMEGGPPIEGAAIEGGAEEESQKPKIWLPGMD